MNKIYSSLFLVSVLIFLGNCAFSQSVSLTLDDGSPIPEHYSFTEEADQAYQSKTMACPSNSNILATYASNNAQRGLMFDIDGITPITIRCFEMNFNTGTSNVEIYTKTGTHVGFTGTPGAWTLVGTASNVVGAGANLVTVIPISLSLAIPAGTTRAFYITRSLAAGPTVAYTNGTAVGAIHASDANIRLREGTGKDYPFGTNFVPRRFNGRVFYDLGVLPVEFAGFTAEYKNEKVELNWTTATEKNNKYFTIERSTDALNFKELKHINALGNTSSYSYYSAADETPLTGIAYYRIKQTDFDGSFGYSSIVAVSKNPSQLLLSASPVPAEEFIKLTFNQAAETGSTMKIYNTKGQVVYEESFNALQGYNEKFIQVSTMDPGLYHIHLYSGNEVQRTKFLKK